MTRRAHHLSLVASASIVVALVTAIACGGGGDITITPPKSPRNLTVIGSGSGRVASQDSKIDCKVTAGAPTGPSCTASYDSGTVVTLTATPDADQEFKAWTGGDCTSATSCQLTLSRDITASAAFVRATETLSLELTTPASDDGAAIIKIDGPSVLGVVGTSGVEIAARPSGTTAVTSRTIMVRGSLTNGVIARVTIRGIHLGDPTYAATVLSVAARKPSYALRETLTSYRATLKP